MEVDLGEMAAREKLHLCPVCTSIPIPSHRTGKGPLHHTFVPIMDIRFYTNPCFGVQRPLRLEVLIILPLESN